MKELITTIIIPAAPEEAWACLINFAHYGQWNSFITKVSGEPTEGQQLDVTISPPCAKAMHFKPTVLSVVPNQELRWVGTFLSRFIFRGEHYFKLRVNEHGHTVFTHGEKFSGLLVPLIWNELKTKTRLGFENMNNDLSRLITNNNE